MQYQTTFEFDLTAEYPTRAVIQLTLATLTPTAWAYLVIEHQDVAEIYALDTCEYMHVPEGMDEFMVAKTLDAVTARLASLVGCSS